MCVAHIHDGHGRGCPPRRLPGLITTSPTNPRSSPTPPLDLTSLLLTSLCSTTVAARDPRRRRVVVAVLRGFPELLQGGQEPPQPRHLHLRASNRAGTPLGLVMATSSTTRPPRSSPSISTVGASRPRRARPRPPRGEPPPVPPFLPSPRRCLSPPHAAPGSGRWPRSQRALRRLHLAPRSPHVRPALPPGRDRPRAGRPLAAPRACAPAAAAGSVYCRRSRCLLLLRCGYLSLLLCRRCCSPFACCSCTAVLLGRCLMLRLLLLCLPLPLVAAAVCC